MFKVRLQKEVWDDDRYPKLIVAWELVSDSLEVLLGDIRVIASGLPELRGDSKWEIVITHESA